MYKYALEQVLFEFYSELYSADGWRTDREMYRTGSSVFPAQQLGNCVC